MIEDPFDFNPTFIGEYKIPPREPKVEKKKEEEEPEKQLTLLDPLSNKIMAASETLSPLVSNLEDFDPLLYENPPSLSEMANLYGPSFHILAKCGYNCNGCGAQEQGIKIPLENNFCDTTFGLACDPFEHTKASMRPSINVNVISTSLSIKYPEYIDCDSSSVFFWMFFPLTIP